MKFSTSVVGVIQRRSSCRTFEPQPLDPDLKEKLIRILAMARSSPMGGQTRFELIDLPELDRQEQKKLGTYGVIKGAKNFIAGAMQKSEYDHENYGYLLEKLILFATDLGLGTCWLGGTFRRSRFATQLNTTDNEHVPAITPVGYPAEKRSFIDRLFKWGAQSRTRLPWSSLFFVDHPIRPITPNEVDDYVIPLEMVRIAPSAANKQPWRIVKEKNTHHYHFHLYRKKRKTHYSFPDLPRIDMGIAICHFNLTILELRLKGRWQFNDPNISPSSHLEYVISWIGD